MCIKLQLRINIKESMKTSCTSTILYSCTIYPISCAEFQWHFDYVMPLMPVPHRLHDLELLVPANGMEGQCDKQTFKLMKKYLGLHQTKCISSSSSGQQTLKSRPKKNIIQKFRAKNYPKLQCRTPWSKAPIAGSCPVSPRHAKRMSLNLVNLCTALPPPP